MTKENFIEMVKREVKAIDKCAFVGTQSYFGYSIRFYTGRRMNYRTFDFDRRLVDEMSEEEMEEYANEVAAWFTRKEGDDK